MERRNLESLHILIANGADIDKGHKNMAQTNNCFCMQKKQNLSLFSIVFYF